MNSNRGKTQRRDDTTTDNQQRFKVLKSNDNSVSLISTFPQSVPLDDTTDGMSKSPVYELKLPRPVPRPASASVPDWPFPEWIDDKHIELAAGTDTVHDTNKHRITDNYDTACVKIHTSGLNSLNNVGSYQIENNECYVSWLAGDGRHITPSKVEDQTVDYFEENFDELSVRSKRSIVVRDIDILDEEGNIRDDLVKKIVPQSPQTELTEPIDLLVINFTDDFTADKYNTIKTRLGNIILKFLFNGDYNHTNAFDNFEGDFNLCFDAAVPRLDKIFANNDNVHNLITPQKIADSSSVLKNLYGNRSKYVFPKRRTDANANANNGNVVEYTSNIMTKKNNIKMTLHQRGDGEYNERNRNDFVLNIIEHLPNLPNQPNQQRSTSLTFGNDVGVDTGPSINYLADVIANPLNNSNGKRPSKAPSVLDINTTFSSGNNNKGHNVATNILIDLKRTGDWEQCNAVKMLTEYENDNGEKEYEKTVLCTGDRLCALYSRIIGNPTIYGSDKKLVIAKGKKPPEKLTDDQKLEYYREKYKILITEGNPFVEYLVGDIDVKPGSQPINISSILDRVKNVPDFQKYETIGGLIKMQFNMDKLLWQTILGSAVNAQENLPPLVSNHLYDNQLQSSEITTLITYYQSLIKGQLDPNHTYSKFKELQRRVNLFFNFNHFNYNKLEVFKEQVKKMVPDDITKIIDINININNNNGKLKNGSTFAGYNFEMYQNIRDLFEQIKTMKTTLDTKKDRYREMNKVVITERFRKAITKSGNSMVDSLISYLTRMKKIQEEKLSQNYDLMIEKLNELVAILSREYNETEYNSLFVFNSKVITDAYNIITGNNPIYTPPEQAGGSQVGGEGEEEENKFNYSSDERLNNVILFFENIRTWKDDQAHIRGQIRGQILHNQKLNSIIYDFVETYQVVDHQSRRITDRADQMFLFFAVALLVSIHYIDIKEEYSKKMIDDNDENLVENAKLDLTSNKPGNTWMLVYTANHTILTYNNPSNSSPAGFVQAICDESMIFSDEKQQLIKDVIEIANRTDKPLNDWLVDRLSWLVKEIARAVLVQDKKLDDLIKPIYDTYEPYHHDNDNKNLKKKDLLFGKVFSDVLDLTHHYYQIAYLDSLTILSRPERLLPPPPPGGGGRRTRKHRTKRRTRSEKKGPRRTRKKKNKKQRMSRKRNKSTKT